MSGLTLQPLPPWLHWGSLYYVNIMPLGPLCDQCVTNRSVSRASRGNVVELSTITNHPLKMAVSHTCCVALHKCMHSEDGVCVCMCDCVCITVLITVFVSGFVCVCMYVCVRVHFSCFGMKGDHKYWRVETRFYVSNSAFMDCDLIRWAHRTCTHTHGHSHTHTHTHTHT